MSALSRLERDTFEFWAEFAHRPGGARGTAGGATWFRSGVPFANYNGIEEALEARGLTLAEDAPGMVARVADLPELPFPVYNRLGFQAVCSFRSWQIA